jgi:hypothetical protein
VQGRNPLPKGTVTTNSMGTHTDLEEITIEDAKTQNEEAIPSETVDAEVQTYTLVSEEIPQSLEHDSTIKRLEEELIHSQQILIQSSNELTTMAEHLEFQSQEHNAIVDRLETKLIQAQQALTQSREEMITRAEHPKFVKQLKDMSATESETYAELTKAQEKVKKMKSQFEKSLEQIKEICDVYYDVINYRAPTTNYTLFLLECYLFLRVKSIRAGKPITFATVPEFISCFREHKEKMQYFLCELYFHNFILEYDRKNNLGLFIGDIQFQTFMSFTKNQVRWGKAHVKNQTSI